MSNPLRAVANKIWAKNKLRQIDKAIETGALEDLLIAADMDINDPLIAEMSMPDCLDALRVRMTERFSKIYEIELGEKWTR